MGGGGGNIAPPLLTSALDGGEWLSSRPGRFTSGEIAPGTHWIGGWVGPRAGLDTVDPALKTIRKCYSLKVQYKGFVNKVNEMKGSL
jgi:hypothetical protein